MKIFSLVLVSLASAFFSADAFTSLARTSRSGVPLALDLAKDTQELPTVANTAMRFLGVAALGTFLSFTSPSGPASASSDSAACKFVRLTFNVLCHVCARTLPFSSQTLSFNLLCIVRLALDPTTVPQPTLLLSDSIKTMDMSMPSYGSLSDAKASVENVKDLTVDPSKEKSNGVPQRGGKKSAGSYAAGPTKADKKKAELEQKRLAREQFERENIRK